MATVATDRLDQPGEAIDLWQSVLMSPRGRQALEQATLFERADQPMDLAEVLDKRVALSTDAAEQVALLSDPAPSSSGSTTRTWPFSAIATSPSWSPPSRCAARAAWALRAVSDFESLATT